jgi:hypothetical protein
VPEFGDDGLRTLGSDAHLDAVAQLFNAHENSSFIQRVGVSQRVGFRKVQADRISPKPSYTPRLRKCPRRQA